MTILSYLLLGFIALLAVSTWALWHAINRAADGYEDSLGFHLGTMATPSSTPTTAPVPGFSTITGMATGSMPMSASDVNLQTAAAPVTTTLKSPDAAPGPLYRRHRRSSNSRPPIRVASASPFEIQCAATRQRAAQTVDSTPPIDVSAKAIIKNILRQKSAP